MIQRYVKECYRRYIMFLQTRPYISNMITTSGLMATGDILAQTFISNEGEKFSAIRTGRMAFLGMFVITPSVLTFYRVMEKKLGSKNAPLKVVLDQGVFAPFMLMIFMPSLDLLSGHSWEYTKKHISDDYWSILRANWTFWPAIQVLNFSVIPPHMRLIVVQTVSLLWNTYLAWKLHSHKN